MLGSKERSSKAMWLLPPKKRDEKLRAIRELLGGPGGQSNERITDSFFIYFSDRKARTFLSCDEPYAYNLKKTVLSNTWYPGSW